MGDYPATVKRFAKHIPLIISAVLIAVIVMLTPWGEVLSLTKTMHPGYLLLLALLGIVYYSGKVIRFWVMLRYLKIDITLRQVALAYMGAQPSTILPAGEVFRTTFLKRYCNIDVHQSAPTITMQGLIEAVTLLGFALAAALILGKSRAVIVLICIVAVAVVIAIKKGYVARYSKLINRLPFISIQRDKLRLFVRGQERLLASSKLVWLLGLSLIPVISGILMVLVAAHGLNTDIDIVKSTIIYTLPVVLAGLSFLPGGFGASEGSSIGIMALLGVAVAPAIAITLLVRVFTLGAGIIMGGIALIILNSTDIES